MRPSKYDRKHQVLIKGAGLGELKELDLAESFGARSSHRAVPRETAFGIVWLGSGGLLDGLSLALEQPDDYYSPPANKRAIKKLHDRLQAEYKSAYGKDGMGAG